jgi:rfaE bifunctional protein nucleotidyltransferase chain/domain
MKKSSDKVKTLHRLLPIIARVKKQGLKIVTTNGSFDLLHIGHLRYLQEAKRKGDLLIVGINSDSSVKTYKDKRRPIIPDKERAEMVAGFECVDYVFIFKELTPQKWLAKVRADVHVKGAQYKISEIPERVVVEKYGGSVYRAHHINKKSSTDIIKTVIKRFGKQR